MSGGGQSRTEDGEYQASQPWDLEPWALAGTGGRLAWCILPQLRRLGSLCPDRRIESQYKPTTASGALAMSANQPEGVGGCAGAPVSELSE